MTAVTASDILAILKVGNTRRLVRIDDGSMDYVLKDGDALVFNRMIPKTFIDALVDELKIVRVSPGVYRAAE